MASSRLYVHLVERVRRARCASVFGLHVVWWGVPVDAKQLASVGRNSSAAFSTGVAGATPSPIRIWSEASRVKSCGAQAGVEVIGRLLAHTPCTHARASRRPALPPPVPCEHLDLESGQARRPSNPPLARIFQ